MIVFDASTIVGAALKADSTPERALLTAEQIDIIALSTGVLSEVAEVLARPKFRAVISPDRRAMIMDVLLRSGLLFEPTEQVTDCRDPKDDRYLELALAASATFLVSSDKDLLVLHPWRGTQIVTPADYVRLMQG